jgi:hypothetical protein
MQEGNVLVAIKILSPTQAAMRRATCAPAGLLAFAFASRPNALPRL